MTDFSPIESIVDGQLRKLAESSSVLGDAETTGGAVARGAAYMTPFVGTGLSFADSWNDFKHGNIGWGLANLGLGALGAVSDAITAISLLGGPAVALGAGQRAALGTFVAGTKAARMARMARIAKTVGKGALRRAPLAAVAAGGEMLPVLEKDRADRVGSFKPFSATDRVADDKGIDIPTKAEYGDYANGRLYNEASPKYGYDPMTYRYRRLK